MRSRLGFTQEPLYLMDGTAFMFRGFYAYQNMARQDGFPTNALFIVTRMLLKLLREERPAHFAFIMDGKGPNFRNGIYAQYKAQRGATPEGLVRQLEPLRRTVSALGIPLIVSRGCEADDCIASLCGRFRAERPIVIIGADKDLKQCLAPNVVLWDPGAKDEKLITLEAFQAETGMEPSSWPDFQAIIGDASDNIPGIPGVGPKTALELFAQFSKLEEIRDRLAAVHPKIRKKLEGRMDAAFLYRRLTTLDAGACADITELELRVRPLNLPATRAVLEEFELRSLLRDLFFMHEKGLVRATMEGSVETAVHAGNIAVLEPQPPLAAAPAVPRQPARSVAGQGSLLDMAVTPVLDSGIRECAHAEELAVPADAVLAVVPLDQGIIVAAGGKERLFTGGHDALARRCASVLSGTGGAILVAPDLKALYGHAHQWKNCPVARCFDLSLAAYLLNPEERGYGWQQLTLRWSEQLASAVNPHSNPGLYAMALYETLRSRLQAAEQASLMHKVEMPLIPVIFHMEQAGIRIDRSAFGAFLAEAQGSLAALEQRIHALAGGPFNVRSSQQLADVLFERLQLPKAGKTKGGMASTAQEALEKLRGKHAVVDSVLEYRKLEKLRSTYLEPLPRLADADDRIHTTFNMLATATGRLSSSDPNLQNIPVRGPLGSRMRACFIAAPGKSLISADYSQIELRILAHLAQDPILLDAFHKGEDIHTRTATLLFDKENADISPDERRIAKTVNFGLVYGMGPQKLAQELGIGMKEAKAFIARYFERLGKLRDFYGAVEREAAERGFVTTLTGRRRYIPDIHSQNAQIQSQARRQAINARVQGSAADIIKLAMLAAASDSLLQRLHAVMLLQIHDELLFEAPTENAPEAAGRVALLMAGAIPEGAALSVPLVADCGFGASWDAAR